MKLNLKKIPDQVIAVIGASSGMGLKVAQIAAKKGAKVLLVARNEEALRDAVTEIRNLGGGAVYAVADVTDFNQLQAAAHIALREFGRIDSWVQIAGVGHWGFAEDIKIEEARRLFDINFWGLVYGTRIAMQIMKEQGGAIINMGSVESERAIPYHSFYAASKHAIKAYTEAVRVESERRGYPLSFTLIKPSSIDTPFAQHSLNRLPEGEPKLMGPVYHVDVAANTILECCENPHREVTIGSSGRFIESMERVSPRLLDRFLQAFAFGGQQRYDQSGKAQNNFRQASSYEGVTEGQHPGMVRKTSLSTAAVMHPLRTALFVAGGLGLVAFMIETSAGRNLAAMAGAGNLRKKMMNRETEVEPFDTDVASDRSTVFTENPSPS